MRRKGLIVLVHPDDGIRVMFRVVLKREGYVVLEADSADSALEQMDNNRPELLITWMRLPRTSGSELIRTVCSEPAYANVRVLAIGEEEDRESAHEAGADAFHVLPVTGAQIVKAVIQLVGRA